MAHITSREELEEWLKDKPADWAQVIAARAALRVLPHAFAEVAPKEMVDDHTVMSIRALSVSWAARNLPGHDMTYATVAAANATSDIAAHADAALLYAGYAGAVATDAAYAFAVASHAAAHFAAHTPAHAVKEAATAARASDAIYAVWENADHDCEWLERNAASTSAAEMLTHIELFPAGEPKGWRKVCSYALMRLGALDPTYQVWIDWYNRRIEGHDAAFDIPGDIDRVHDKAILARLADATDEDFWGKGATYVNTTLQGWIDDARIEARVEDILRKLRSGASAHYGTPEDLAGRAALLDELDRLLGKSPQARHGIGGNYPPEPIGAVEQSAALPQEMREPLEALSTELEKREPDALVVVEQVKLLHRVVRKLGKMADIAGDEFAKEFGGELGKGAAKLITRVPYLAVIYTLITMILDWLAPLIHISG